MRDTDQKTVGLKPAPEVDLAGWKPRAFKSKHTFSNAPVCLRHRKKKARRRLAKASRRVNRQGRRI